MNRYKINQQAKVLRAKKLAKSVTPIAPKVQDGVVQVEIPLPKTTPLHTYSIPKPPTHLAKKTTNAEQKNATPVKPQNVATSQRPSKKGCTGCRRRIRQG